MDINEKRYSIKDIIERVFSGMTLGTLNKMPDEALEEIEQILCDGFNIDPKDIKLSLETKIVVEE